MSRPDWALPGKAVVRVTLADGSVRLGQILRERGTTVVVEYQTPAGHFRCRTFARASVEPVVE